MYFKRIFRKKIEKSEILTDSDYKQFEKLFNKLSLNLNHPISICQGINDGYSIGVYDEKTGNLKTQAMSYDVKNCVSILKNNILNYDKSKN